MAVIVMLVLFLLIEPGISQLNGDENINGNAPVRSFCGPNPPIILSSFINNRNSTLTQLRSQLSSTGVFYSRAQSLSDGDSVFGDAQCRQYLSEAQCVACFDSCVSQLVPCITGNGAYAFSDNCFVRYENYPNYYNDPSAVEQITFLPLDICGNQSASQTSSFSEAVDGLLSDIRVATPRAPNWYVASTRQVSNENATVYAVAQCVENTSQTICQDCLNRAHSDLYNCLPNTEGRFIDQGCFARYSITPFFSDNQITDITNLLKEKKSNKVPIIAGAVGGVSFFFLVIALGLYYLIWKKSKRTEEDARVFKGAVNYNYKHLQLATKNFSEENSIGRGGFGEVFKAIHEDNQFLAVKKLEVRDARAKQEFENEILLISQIHHRNLLRLLGWSSEGSNLLLVLEYMPNGSLDRFLWGPKRGTLNWKQRYDIIVGIARGLAHLHNECHVRIIHRDIKSSNILLDDHFQAKIADFGLAKFQPDDQSHVVTKFAGTLGYTAPEYARHGLLSDKVDTFSLGIVILEIISGQRCNDVNIDGPITDYLIEHAWKLYENKEHMKLVDETMDARKYEEEHLMKIIEIALLCTQSPAINRPTMSEVLLMLQDGQSLGERQLTRPTYIDHNRRIHIGSIKNSIATGDLFQKQKGTETNEHVRINKADDQLDVMEKGTKVANIW
ncbi:cysteine-rich receptor-like protein kinase 43 [Lactuca sativa]|uniref:Protein kinase domain-containing protein n=1 Tax=Lactuca sativa TaxID=4236 RepID=A0A9R1WF89_LACSA|nr:cysteine-rich receptor-like protein kinase 43 [Lactuca sativa]KAJ0221198.1 hypothetical protein LSAT_V11C200075870 [Lactuca sativa]